MPLVDAQTAPSSPRGYLYEIVPITANTTLTENHRDRVLQVNSGSDVTLTLPRTLPNGFHCKVEQLGAGQVIFSAASGATLGNDFSHDRTPGQYGLAELYVTTNSNGYAAVYNLGGHTTNSTGTFLGMTSTIAELNILSGVTSSAAELNLLDGVTASTAELNIVDGVTSTAAEINLLDNVVASVSWAVAAGASNVCVLTGTLKDAAGATIAAARPIDLYISEAVTGIGITADTYSTGASITTGTQIIAFTANKAWRINTHTDGTFAISITDTAKPADQYAVAIVSTKGTLSISAASAALWGA